MIIGKPFRVILPSIPAGIAAAILGGILSLTGILKLVSVIFVGVFTYLVFNVTIHKLDWYLRKTTKESSWLRSAEGVTWLGTTKGKEWAKQNGYNL